MNPPLEPIVVRSAEGEGLAIGPSRRTFLRSKVQKIASRFDSRPT